MGRGFGISPVVVLLAVLVWGWVLGPIGMLLAVPLTMAVKSSLDSLRQEELVQQNAKSIEDETNPQKKD
jgi:predicted PurR-regulated permease PerM